MSTTAEHRDVPAPLELTSRTLAEHGGELLDSQRAQAAPAFVLVPEQDSGAAGLLQTLRRHPDPDIYLKPVLLRCQQPPPAELAQACDGSWAGSPGELPQGLLQVCSGIRDSIVGLARAPGGDTGLPLRLLRFMACRGGPLSPLPTARHRQGHVYPSLEPLASAEPGAVLNSLEVLEEQRVIQGELHTTAYECAHCGCAFLNFTENCPQCAAVDLSHDDLVHHFRCGYTAELGAFRRGEQLVCPKCDRALHHIGVDYDKPSSMFHCRSCTHDFQEPTIRTTCYDCGHNSAPENLPQRSVKRFMVTALGQNAAALGLESLFMSVMERRLNLCPWDAFQMFLKVEAARIARYRRSRSSLLLLQLCGVDELYVRLGRRADDVFEELAEAMTQILRRSDLITARHDALFVALLTETDEAQAARAAARLDEGVGELLQNNMGTTAGLRVKVANLDPEADPQALLQALMD